MKGPRHVIFGVIGRFNIFQPLSTNRVPNTWGYLYIDFINWIFGWIEASLSQHLTTQPNQLGGMDMDMDPDPPQGIQLRLCHGMITQRCRGWLQNAR